MKNYLLKTGIIFLFVFVKQSPAQCWEDIGGGLNSLGRSFYADSATNLLYIGGNFGMAGGITARQIARWNGTAWDSLAGGSQGGSQVLAITKYNGDIYACGTYFGNNNPYNGRWNGTTWDSLP